ncbi:MAG: PAS domain S-box protein, partial [Chloroflexota bacterium]
MKNISDLVDSSQASKLRQQAEAFYRQQNPNGTSPQTEIDLQELVYELQVHQIELEMQNEELCQARTEREKSYNRYSNLFNFAPVGYLTLSAEGIILEANFKAATMLGLVKSRLVKWQLVQFILPADMNIYYQLRQTLYASRTAQACEIRLMKNDGIPFWVHMDANLVQDVEPSASVCHITLNVITERKQAEQALRESEQRYRLLVDNLADGVYRSTPQGKFVSVNPAMVKMFGYASQEEMLALDIKKDLFYSPEDRQNMILHANQRQGVIGSYRMRRKDGSEIWVEDNAQYVFDERGKVLFHEGILRDITVRRQAEEARRIQHDLSLALIVCDNLEQALAAILNSLMQIAGIDCGGIYLVDALSGGFDLVVHTGLSQQFIAETAHFPAGAPQIELARKGQNLYVAYDDVRPESSAARQQEGLRAIAIIPVMHQGELLAIWNLASHTHDDLPEPVRKTIETLAIQIGSIQMHLLSDAALQKSRQNLQILFNSITEFLFILDSSGCIQDVNPVACGRLAYSAQELQGQNVLMVHPPERRDEVAAVIADMLAGRRDSCDIPLQTKTGELIPVETVVTKGEWGGKPALFGISRDISERKKVEEELQRINAEFENQTAIANQMAAEAEQATLVKSAFLANMSHEIRSPMNGVIGMTSLLLNSSLNEEQRNYAEMIRTSGESLLNLINDILDFSKNEAGRLELEDLDFDLLSSLDTLVSAQGVLAREKSLELICAVDPNVPSFLRGDPRRLRQILTNLISNAIKFTQHGEVAIHVTKLSETKDEVTLRFAVRDTGIGIPPEKLGLLFDKFRQADSSITRQYGGTGLGLAISKQLVELMGGEIGVQSQEGKGSEFWFTLRLKMLIERRAASLRQTDAEFITQTLDTHKRILLVEDKIVHQKVALGILKKLGLRADVAANGLEALHALENQPYDLVLMDVQMPEMDGLEATHQIRNLQSKVLDHEIPIIALTANAMPGDRERCFQAGMNDYVEKPVNAQVLALA